MVKQLSLILIFSILYCGLSHGQVVEWSNQQKLKSKINYTQVIGENASGLYMLRGKSNSFSKELIIEKYKNNLAIEVSTDLAQPNNSLIESVKLLNDGVLVLATKYNDSLPEIDILAWKLNSQLVPTPESKIIGKIDRGLYTSNNAISFQQSVNKQFYSVTYFTTGATKNTSILNLQGFDASLAKTYNKAFALPFDAEDIVISGAECDNEGNVFMLIDYPRLNEKNHKEKNLRDFYVYAYYKSIDKTLEYEIKQDSTFINDIGLALNNLNKTLHIAGFYSTENNNRVSGSFSVAINTESTLMEHKVFEPINKTFSIKVVSTMLNERGNDLTDLYIRKIIPRSDGGVTIIAEKYYETQQTYTYYANGFPQTASRITYNYDEIVVFSKNASGITEFNDFIKKNQSSMNDAGYYSSFVLLNSNTRLSFVYNSNVNDDGDVMISSINPLGQIENKILIKALSFYVQLMPKESKQINANSSLICTLKDRRFTLMKLTY